MLPGCSYHVFNHANGKENLFSEPANYQFFLAKLSLHVLPVANICAYCLMPNHFHLLVQIKSGTDLLYYFMKTGIDENTGPRSGITDEQFLTKKISKSFSNLFNSYTQAFNKMYGRKGSLFMQNMKRQEIKDEASFCKVVHYIHANPVHHGFVKSISEWKYSSYQLFLSTSPTKLNRDIVVKAFGSLDWFIAYHQQPIDLKNKWIDY
jgi:REP element-mobilizing transposase RayT